MLTIKPKQLDAITSANRQRFHQELLELYRSEIADQISDLDDNQMLSVIKEFHEVAESFKIESRRGVSRFVGLRLITWPHFDQIPEVNLFLKREDIPANQKMDLIYDKLLEHFGKTGQL